VKSLFHLLLLVISLHTSLSALDDVDLEFEVGMMNASFSGDISNTVNAVSFDGDLGYNDNTSSYFSLKAKFGNEWIPVIHVNYKNFSEGQSSVLSNHKIGDTYFDELTKSNIKYTVLNSIFYYEFKSKGKKKRMFGKQRYTGDLEIDLGVNVKNIDYSYDMVGNVSGNEEYINVSSSILLPYVGMKYYLYHLSLYADISTLSFSDVKATSYNFGIDYEMVRNLYLALTYFYEDFEETIINDTVTFKSSGLMFSVKYDF